MLSLTGCATLYQLGGNVISFLVNLLRNGGSPRNGLRLNMWTNKMPPDCPDVHFNLQ